MMPAQELRLRDRRKVRIEELEHLHTCNDCQYKFSPVCKYCELDGACVRCGLDRVKGKCPSCGRTFEDDVREHYDKQELRYTTSISQY